MQSFYNNFFRIIFVLTKYIADIYRLRPLVKARVEKYDIMK